MSSFLYLLLIVAFNDRILFVESCLINSGSSNPEVSVLERSTPLNSSHCYTMHTKGQSTAEMGVEFTHGAYTQWTV